jgi:very-short-patch-repair endonuclease
MRMSAKIGVANAKALRRAMTLPEIILWQALRARPGGFKFRRQHSAGPYVLDFYCAAAALCIEVDGKAHDMGDNPARDVRRDGWLAEQGVRTLRIAAEEVLCDLEPVIRFIEVECATRMPLHHSPSANGPPPAENRGRI